MIIKTKYGEFNVYLGHNASYLHLTHTIGYGDMVRDVEKAAREILACDKVRFEQLDKNGPITINRVDYQNITCEISPNQTRGFFRATPDMTTAAYNKINEDLAAEFEAFAAINLHALRIAALIAYRNHGIEKLTKTVQNIEKTREALQGINV